MKEYFYLMRLHKPVGIFLLLWPTLWALWIAGLGKPNLIIVMIFIIGVILMRSAGCVINDFADRHMDKYISRTQNRPLTSGKILPRNALVLFFVLLLMSFLLVLLLNSLTIQLAFFGAFFAIFYPFMKRFTHLPQLGLGVAFAWGIPMAFAAIQNHVPLSSWMLFLAGAIWPVIYDTMYAMVDREDDLKVGVKSTAILFGEKDRLVLGILQIIFLSILLVSGIIFHLKMIYFLSILIAGLFFIYQQKLIYHRDSKKCFQAFLNNQWVGLVIFIGIFLSYEL